MLETKEDLGDRRRAELADFLRRKRATLTTEMAGLPTTARRRTPGLRREEVAELADISTALYAWLEQGRDVPISRRTIDAISRALQCTAAERDHVRALALDVRGELDEAVPATLARFIDSLETHPTFVLDHKWDVVDVNLAARLVFSFDDDLRVGMNLLEAMFDDDRKSLFVDWHDVAEGVVELFRYDYALYAAEPEPLALVERLRRQEPAFAAMWDAHRVRRTPPNFVRRLNHPDAGSLSLESSLYAVIEAPGLRTMIFTPSDDATARAIAALVATSHGATASGDR